MRLFIHHYQFTIHYSPLESSSPPPSQHPAQRVVASPTEYFSGLLTNIDPAHREILFASLFLVLWLLVGTLGYTAIEGWSLMDGLYMTFITLTTIGFGETHTLSTTGRLFTILIAFVGIGSVAFVAARSAQVLLAGQRLRQRQMTRRIKHMHDHYIICGYGRIGKRVAADLQTAGKPFVVLERDEELVAAMQEAGVPAMVGDAEDEATLRQAGIEHAQGLITLLPEDSDNVFVTLVAREINPRLFILARTNNSKNRRKLLQAGAAQVVAPSEVGADRMAQVILRPNVDRVMEQVLKTSSLSLQMEEVKVETDAPLAGKSLAESQFRQQFDVVVITIIKGASGEMTFNPGPSHQIEAGDILIVLGSQEMISRLAREGCRAS